MIVELSLDEDLKLIQVKERMSFSGRRKSIFGEKRSLQVGKQCAIVGEDSRGKSLELDMGLDPAV